MRRSGPGPCPDGFRRFRGFRFRGAAPHAGRRKRRCGRARGGRGPKGGKCGRCFGRPSAAHLHGRPRVVDHRRGAGRDFDPRGLLLDCEDGLRRSCGPHHVALSEAAGDDPHGESGADDRGPQDQLPRLQPPRRAGLRAERAADGGRLLHRRHDQRGGPLDSDRSLSVPAFGGAQGGHGALSRAAARGPAGYGSSLRGGSGHGGAPPRSAGSGARGRCRSCCPSCSRVW